ncbi:MAG: type II CRISPR-associated endonuclease Cas1 [Bacteroidetes bacterium]|nr:type II CRISPR-associated endonuclease Cas1 [Bacteroidota bacterium]
MIKRTLYFGNPAYLCCNNQQLQVERPAEKDKEKERPATIPIEDIGVVILDHPQITITHHLMHRLLDVNCALITCDDKHMPAGLLLNLEGNTLQQERFDAQIAASVPLKKQLWANTVSVKIMNQAAILKFRGVKCDNMLHWASSVKSGDTANHEGRAAAYYWQNLFPEEYLFLRDPDGNAPNNLLNYGYAILRAITARSLVGSGLLPTLGIFHRNRYNAYCLADDIMEPYRPYVDKLVLEITDSQEIPEELTRELKAKMLAIASIDVNINEQTSPLMVAVQQTTSSLAKCYLGELRKIIYPKL